MSHSNQMLLDVYKFNLCTYMLLPFCSVNIDSFGGEVNLVNVWVEPDGSKVFIKVHSFDPVNTDAFQCKYWLGTWSTDPRMLVYRMPYPWRPEFSKFVEGKWSQYSDRAKTFLKKNSGLGYLRPKNEGGFQSDVRLLALDRDETLRLELQVQLNAFIPHDAELMKRPDKEEFMVPD